MRTIGLRPNRTGHAAPITHVAVRPDGRRLASCSYDGTVLVWDTTDPTAPARVAELRHRRLVNGSAWNPTAPELLATASADKTVAIWRVSDDGRVDLVNVLARHTDDINSVAWMPDGERIICVSEDGRATMWSASAGGLIGEVGSHAAHCMMVSVNRCGLVATVGEDGMVAVTDPAAETAPAVRRYDCSIEGCAWSHSGEVLAVARDDGAVDLLTPRAEWLRTVRVSRSAARTVDWSDDDRSLVVGAYDGALHFFDADGARLNEVRDARLWPRSVSAARGLLAAGSFWSTPHLFDFGTGAELAAPAASTNGPNALAVAGGELFVGCDSGTVLAVDFSGPGDANPVRALTVTDGPILSMHAEPGVLYAGTYSGHVLRLRTDGTDGTDAERLSSEQLGAPVPSLCRAGEPLVAGTYNGDLVGLDPATLAVVDHGPSHSGSVKSLSPFADGFLSAATDRTLAAGTLRQRTVIWEHGNLINAVAALDGQVVATASRDHTVKVGRLVQDDRPVPRLVEVRTLLGPDESVKCVGLLGTPDNPVVLAGSYDFGLYAWHVNWADSAASLIDGRLVAEFRQGLSCMVPLDGRRLAVAGWDGRIAIVGLDADGAVHVLRWLDVHELAANATTDHPPAVGAAKARAGGHTLPVTPEVPT
jgi:WD40 repeat protein